MKKTLAVIAVAVLFGAASASAGEKKLLYFNPELVAGLGATKDHGSGDVYTPHLAVGGTLFSLDKSGNIGFIGAGYALDLYDFQHHDGRLRDLARESSGNDFLGGFGTAGFFTCIPVRVGPLAYQFSWSRHVRSFGQDRGRLHLITLDILGFVRLYKTP